MSMITRLESFSVEQAPTREAIMDGIDEFHRMTDEAAGELLLVRHAEAAYGGNDPLLSCAGLEQAERLAERLESLWVEAVYTAPERRALQTAQIVGSVIDWPVQTIDELADIAFDASKAQGCGAPEYTELLEREPRWDALPGFESGKPFRRRAVQAVESILSTNSGRRVVVVTHSAVINAYVSMLLSVPADQFFTPEHTSISVVRWLESRYALRCLNDVAHLRAVVPRL